MAARFVLDSGNLMQVLLPAGSYRIRPLDNAAEVGASGDIEAHEVEITAGRVTQPRSELSPCTSRAERAARTQGGSQRRVRIEESPFFPTVGQTR